MPKRTPSPMRVKASLDASSAGFSRRNGVPSFTTAERQVPASVKSQSILLFHSLIRFLKNDIANLLKQT